MTSVTSDHPFLFGLKVKLNFYFHINLEIGGHTGHTGHNHKFNVYLYKNLTIYAIISIDIYTFPSFQAVTTFVTTCDYLFLSIPFSYPFEYPLAKTNSEYKCR